MDHLLPHTATARIGGVGAHGKILITKHAPHAEDLEALGFIGIDQKTIDHFNTCHKLAKSSVHSRGWGPPAVQPAALLAAEAWRSRRKSAVISTQCASLSPVRSSLGETKYAAGQPRCCARPRATGSRFSLRFEMCSSRRPPGLSRARYKSADSAVSRCSGIASLENASRAMRS